MKVSDLKAELKRRNLPVSGAKPQLIERLKPYSDSAISSCTTSSPSDISTVSSNAMPAPVSVGGALVSPALHQTTKSETQPMSPPVSMDTTITVAAFHTCEPTVGIYQLSNGIQQSQSSVVPMDIDTNVTTDPMEVGENAPKEDIVQFQQKRIEELQWELQ
ncbi:MKL/myocardin-like protein 2, partial [Limulus polyphemus]|uniref:MKL/myocardin-like protein 2 n=1 Tax=Limulus polyphemus TaxID=6850 RepID=A0ABM1RZD7_LIMPO